MWPMRSRLYTIWSFRWKEEGRVDCGGIMGKISLFWVCEFQSCCHLLRIYLLIIGFRSVNGTGIWRIGLFNADLAALSAFSLPVMPTWLGNQQNRMLKDLEASLWYCNRIWCVIGCSSFLLRMVWRLERESENIM